MLILLRLDSVLRDDVFLLLSTLSLLVEFRSEIGERNLEFFDLLSSSPKIVNTRAKAFDLLIVTVLNLLQVGQVKVDAVEEGLWRDVRLTSKFKMESICSLLD